MEHEEEAPRKVRQIEGLLAGQGELQRTTINITTTQRIVVEGVRTLENLPRNHPLGKGGGLRFRCVRSGERV